MPCGTRPSNNDYHVDVTRSDVEEWVKELLSQQPKPPAADRPAADASVSEADRGLELAALMDASGIVRPDAPLSLDDLTRIACKAIRRAGGVAPPALRAWWAVHSRYDSERFARTLAAFAAGASFEVVDEDDLRGAVLELMAARAKP